jgi:hypothetical protein
MAFKRVFHSSRKCNYRETDIGKVIISIFHKSRCSRYRPLQLFDLSRMYVSLNFNSWQWARLSSSLFEKYNNNVSLKLQLIHRLHCSCVAQILQIVADGCGQFSTGNRGLAVNAWAEMLAEDQPSLTGVLDDIEFNWSALHAFGDSRTDHLCLWVSILTWKSGVCRTMQLQVIYRNRWDFCRQS